MNAYITLQTLALSPKHKPTGKTSHYRNNEKLPVPSSLKIAKFKDDEGFYLLYLDAEGNELTDTHHETLEGALAQATWEFGVKPDEWETGAPGDGCKSQQKFYGSRQQRLQIESPQKT